VKSYISFPLMLLGLAETQISWADVTWEEQAERLQFVSGALLDHLPMAEGLPGGSQIFFKSNISLLPKTNPTVGSKSESVPSSPIHAIPTVQFDIVRDVGAISSGVRIWGGYLPSGSEKLVGLKASLTEKSYGAGFLLRYKAGFLEPYLEGGAQQSISTVRGAITASDADDTFHVDVLIGYGAIGTRVPSLKMWGNVMTIARNSRSQFSIPSDGTNFELVDGQAPVGFQLSTGMELFWGLNVGVGQLYLPNRLTMTRVLSGIKVNL
jgi:hypothetical protein